MSVHRFSTREEIINFLKDYNFKYYIPPLDNSFNKYKDEDKYYTAEIVTVNGTTFVNNCNICARTEDKRVESFSFFEKRNSYKYLTMEEGEKRHLHIQKLIKKLKDKR